MSKASLHPFTISERVKLSIAALNFFSPIHYKKNAATLAREVSSGVTMPFSAADFLTFLEKTDQLTDGWQRNRQIASLLRSLRDAGFLDQVGAGRAAFMGEIYYSMLQITKLQKRGSLWLASALGAEFVYFAFANIVSQLCGETKDGDEHAGTAVVIAPNWLLTCAHVVRDMKLHDTQDIQGSQRKVIRTLAHPRHDVALVEIESAMVAIPSLGYREPVIGEAVYTLGYPKVPLAAEPTLILQKGEVSNDGLITIYGHRLFLYSAAARPGNSGGPLIAASGHIVGMTTEELFDKSNPATMPLFAGTPTAVIASAIADFDVGVDLPLETYES